MSRKRITTGLLLTILGVLAAYSLWLALNRIYQVDECQNLYMARVLATGQGARFFTSGSLFLLGPLSWLAEHAVRSATLFTEARLLFLIIFWLNLLLLGWIAGGSVFSIRGLIALVAASTLAPLWDYGFEIRHDNLILTGVLLTWWLIRVKPMGFYSYAWTGVATVAMLFIAVKTIVYALPLSMAALLFPPPTFNKPRWQLALAWLGGALCALAVIRICYGTGSAWDTYLHVFQHVTGYSAKSAAGESVRFWPWDTLSRLLWQTPLLLALSTTGCLAVIMDFVTKGKTVLTWDGRLPEVILLLGSLAALLANPTPFPYNLINVVPYAFLLAFKYGGELWNELRNRPQLQAIAVAILIFGHLMPFGIATERHINWTNSRQKTLMRLAENLTAPKKDLVYDGVGMVPTRYSIAFEWYLHSRNISTFLNRDGHHVRDLLARHPAAVFIPSYRTDWLQKKDHDFVRQHYVPLADDFWVLGTVLPSDGGSFDIIHPGRYAVVRAKVPKAADGREEDAEPRLVLERDVAVTGKLDGSVIPKHPVELAVGIHHIATARGCRAAVVWVGPHLNHVPNLGPGNHRVLFVNWY